MDKATLIRTLVLLVALINQALMASGLNPVPGTEEVWGEVIATAFTIIMSLVAWFKNNYVTAKGKAQKEAIVKANLK